jgi:hypothetical protein
MYRSGVKHRLVFVVTSDMSLLMGGLHTGRICVACLYHKHKKQRMSTFFRILQEVKSVFTRNLKGMVTTAYVLLTDAHWLAGYIFDINVGKKCTNSQQQI